ncbi:MAG TPA: ABC transporter permease [Bryobacteraceae bacterium]|nr:ABC transporter permease [Bryobacteraceae bacterium]
MDLLYALRMLRKNPGFTAAAVITLALATGANIAIFSIVNGILLRPLPFAEPDRLVQVRDIPPGGGQFSIAPANFIDWRASSKSIDLAAFRGAALNLTGSGEPARVRAAKVTANTFQLLGVEPVQGRSFLPEKDETSKSHVAIIGYGMWQDRFGGQPALGKTLVLDGEPYTLIGIMPAGFRYPLNADVWVPMAFNQRDRAARGAHYISAIARLRPGVSLQQARSEMDSLSRRLEQQFPEDDKGWGIRLTPLIDDTVGSVRTSLWVLAGAVGLVLLIGCANVANLLLARSAARKKEISIRTALGAGRWRLLRQLMTEGFLLALLGTAAGLALAQLAIRAIIVSAPGSVPRLNEARIDAYSLLFSFGVMLLTVFAFALAPALQISRVDLNDALKAGGKTGQSDARTRTRGLLVIAETALAVLLLIGAGLLLKSFLRLQGVDIGLDPNKVLTMSVSLPDTRYQSPQQRAMFFQRLLARLSQVPGIRTAATVGSLPFLDDTIFTIYKEGHTAQGEGFGFNFYSASGSYFEALHIPLRQGHLFTDRDNATGPRTVIINERGAAKLFPGENPIGKRIQISYEPGNPVAEIVGVVGDTKQYGRDTVNTRQIYQSYLQRPRGAMTLVLRTSGDPLQSTNAVRREVLAMDQDLPVADIRSMEEIVNRSVGDRRFSMQLLSIFAALAVLLAAVGTYGVLAYAVVQRTHEIGVRMAIGARGGHILRLVVGEGTVLSAIGVLLGTGGAMVLTRVLKSQLFEVSSTDPFVFAGVIILLIGVAFLASLIPALRASGIDPLQALRDE